MIAAALLFAASTIDLEGDVRRFCTKEWPDDFHMQEYCIGDQHEGMIKFVNINQDAPAGLKRALVLCVVQWTEAGLVDWHMAAYCADKQRTAYERLHD